MTVTREEMRKTRLSLVHQMHDYIMNTGDEEIVEIWLRDAIPDCPCEEDFEYFANDASEFRALCEIFGRLVCYDN
jgi:hypothetical protein